ncbi:HAMP domain-containing histidine kinase [Candidatus Saccharibacteria bacterium]|nr:HAMP domain-containing histidine kinase [Candidatus Saccharibacteria bacterium]
MAIICAICLMFSAAIYQFAIHEVHRGLTNQSQRVIDEYPGFDFDPALKPDWDSSRAAHRILVNLVEFNLIVLVFGGFASFLLARQTLRPIEESHRQQQRFTADVSHELRTPLTALKMDTEVALMDTAASKASLRDTLASNLEEAVKLESLINNLFKLTRLEASELAEQFTDMDIATIVTDAVTDVTQRAKDKKITIKNTVKPATTRGDRTSLTQLMTILLDNAIKYSDDKATINISSAQEKGSVKVAVTDTGIGIEPAALDHVFDRFYRADAARTRNDTSGYGLGLSIAKLIADVHGGSITITSEVGKGTTANIELPMADA